MISRFLRSGFRYSASAMVVGMVLAMAHPAMAQQRGATIDDDATEPVATTSIPVVQSLAPSPTKTLNTALARLARDPRDLTALLDAGGAALDLGDTDAAIGFLTRAEQVAPGTAGVRARMGIAMLRSNQPFEAIRWFDLADQTGFNRTEMATDRGLAYDLIGDNAAAQREYQLALSAGRNDEASRRYALSLVIAGDRRGAELVIQPLLERQDRGAWRVRTFIMAISGQSDEAEGIAKATMPADLAAAISPYLRYMPRLTPAQQAAAANLGRFPRAADIGRDDPQVVQYALAHPRTPRVDAALVPQGEALGARGRDDRSKRRRPGKEDKRETQFAAATPAPAPAPAVKTPPPPPLQSATPTAPAVSAPWGLQPGTRTAAAPQQAATPATTPSTLARPTVLSKLDVPPGTPLAPPPQPRPVTSASTPAPQPATAAPAPNPVLTSKPAEVTPAPAPAQVASAAPNTTSPAPGPQFALLAPTQAASTPPTVTPLVTAPAATTPTPTTVPPPPAPTQAATSSGAPAPADFRSMFDGFKAPEQEASATSTEAVDLARIEALRESARAAAAAKAKERAAKDRGVRPDGPTSVSRTSDADAPEPTVTRGSKEKLAKEELAKDAKAKSAKEKLALDTDCLDTTAKGKSGRGKAGKATPAKGRASAKSKGKGAAEAQCPPENGKAAKTKKEKAELQHPSRIWVQVLTGSNRQAMGKEWQRLVSSSAALRGRKPSITQWRSNYRLLTGPFASDAEALAFVERLRKDSVGSFEWTSPAGQAVDGLSAK
ncbi:SPOR domain-containing protein [Novosphingobium sediminis]|nr:SPOR domain-containing protein [Novosphingobium sediminis]